MYYMPRQVMMDWLAKLCGLPEKFLFGGSSSSSARGHGGGSSTTRGGEDGGGGGGGGVIQGTSSEAVLVAMLAARARALEAKPPDAALRPGA